MRRINFLVKTILLLMFCFSSSVVADSTIAVWGIGSGNKVLFRNGISTSAPMGSDWIEVSNYSTDGNPINIVNFSVGAGQVWGVSSDNKVWFRNGISPIIPMGTIWAPVDGTLTYISVGMGSVWGIDPSGNVLFRTGVEVGTTMGKNWVQMAGGLASISAGKFGMVFGILAPSIGKGVVFRTGITQDASSGNDWMSDLKELINVSVGPNGQAWGVCSDNKILFMKSFSPTGGMNWQLVDNGILSKVCVGPDGQVWGIDPSGNVLFRNGISASTPMGTDWAKIPKDLGNLSFISVGCCSITSMSDKLNPELMAVTISTPPTVANISDIKTIIDKLDYSGITLAENALITLKTKVEILVNNRTSATEATYTQALLDLINDAISKTWVSNDSTLLGYNNLLGTQGTAAISAPTSVQAPVLAPEIAPVSSPTSPVAPATTSAFTAVSLPGVIPASISTPISASIPVFAPAPAPAPISVFAPAPTTIRASAITTRSPTFSAFSSVTGAPAQGTPSGMTAGITSVTAASTTPPATQEGNSAAFAAALSGATTPSAINAVVNNPAFNSVTYLIDYPTQTNSMYVQIKGFFDANNNPLVTGQSLIDLQILLNNPKLNNFLSNGEQSLIRTWLSNISTTLNNLNLTKIAFVTDLGNASTPSALNTIVSNQTYATANLVDYPILTNSVYSKIQGFFNTNNTPNCTGQNLIDLQTLFKNTNLNNFLSPTEQSTVSNSWLPNLTIASNQTAFTTDLAGAKVPSDVNTIVNNSAYAAANLIDYPSTTNSIYTKIQGFFTKNVPNITGPSLIDLQTLLSNTNLNNFLSPSEQANISTWLANVTNAIKAPSASATTTPTQTVTSATATAATTTTTPVTSINTAMQNDISAAVAQSDVSDTINGLIKVVKKYGNKTLSQDSISAFKLAVTNIYSTVSNYKPDKKTNAENKKDIEDFIKLLKSNNAAKLLPNIHISSTIANLHNVLKSLK